MIKKPDDQVMYNFFARTCSSEEKQLVEEYFYENDDFRREFLKLDRILCEMVGD